MQNFNHEYQYEKDFKIVCSSHKPPCIPLARPPFFSLTEMFWKNQDATDQRMNVSALQDITTAYENCVRHHLSNGYNFNVKWL